MVTVTPEGLQKRLARIQKPSSWQKRLDKAVFDVDLTPEQRIRLLQRVAKEGKKVSSDVKVATVCGEGSIPRLPSVVGPLKSV